MNRPAAPSQEWTAVCRYDDLLPERGTAVLIDSTQIALVRTYEGAVHAVGNQEPFTGAFVLSRGIVGSRGDVPTIASPLHKQVFDLRTGECLDDRTVALPVYAARISAGIVEVALR